MSASTPKAANHAGLPPLAMFQMPNRFYERDGRVVDFMGNDWQKSWGALRAR